jgi:hypothetical protein
MENTVNYIGVDGEDGLGVARELYTLDMVLAASGCDQVYVQHRPRLLSDNGPSDIAQDLADYVQANGMD